MIWLILLFLAYVRADDDSLDFGPPKLPPRENAQIDAQMKSVLGEVLTGLYVDNKVPTGHFKYPVDHFYDSSFVELLSACYNNGMAPPSRYAITMTIWDNVQDKLRTISKDTVYCKPGYTNDFYYTFKTHTKILWKDLLGKYKRGLLETETSTSIGALGFYQQTVSTSNPTYLDESAFAAGAAVATATTSAIIAAAAAASAIAGPVAIAAAILAATPMAVLKGTAAGLATTASTYAVACAVETSQSTPPIEYCINTPTSTVKHFVDEAGESVKIPYPYNKQVARDTALDFVRKTSDLFDETPEQYCGLWNSIASGGREYFQPPEFVLDENGYYQRKKCSDYGFENVNFCASEDENVQDERQRQYIANIPYFAQPVDPCPVASTYENFTEFDVEHYHYAALLSNKRLFCELDHREQKKPIIQTNLGKVPKKDFWSGLATWAGGRFRTDAYTGFIYDTGTGLYSTITGLPVGEAIKQKAAERIPVEDNEFDEAETRFVKDKIHEAQNAVMVWALQHCKNSDGAGWTMDSDFYCLLGNNDIKMKGPALTLPLGSTGVSAGITRKFIAKRGTTFIIKNRASYCVVSDETAEMEGGKLAFSPGGMAGFKGRYDKNAAKAAAQKTKNAGKGKISKLKAFKTTAGEKPPYKKWLAKTAGREMTRAFRQSLTDNAGETAKSILKPQAEYWLEEGSCTTNCRFESAEESWDLFAGSISFFSSKTTASYIRAWNPDGNGWNRYLVQLWAHVTIPNAAQIFFAKQGGPRGFLNEIRISLEYASGSGKRVVLNQFGEAHGRLFDGTRRRLSETDSEMLYGTDNLWSKRLEDNKKFGSDCEANKQSTGFATTNGQLCDVNTAGTARRRLSESYNIPDIAVSDTSAEMFDEGTPSRLDKRGVRIQRVVHPTVVKLKGHIHGVQDLIEENPILMNPFRYTSLNETTLTASYKPPPFNVIELNTCEYYGLTTIQLLTHTFNRGLKDILINYMNTQSIDTTLDADTFAYSNRTINFPEWKYDGSQWTGYENSQPFNTTVNDVTITIDPLKTPYADEIIQNLKSAKRTTGLILGPLKENGQQDLRQTIDNLHGAYENEFKTVYDSHEDCNDIMKCVCVPTLGYVYRKYGDIKDYTGNYMINPVYRYDECKQAIGHLNDTTQRSLSEWSREELQGQLNTISSGAFQGCVNDGQYKFFKGEGGSIAELSDNSIVRLYELDLPKDETHTGVMNVYRQNPFDIMKEKHTAIDTKFHMVEYGQPVRFPRHTFGTLKDKNALHTMHEGTFKTIRRVDRYYKKNKDVVEEYYIAEDGGPMIEYLNLKNIDPKSNKYGDTTLIPPAHFVANIDDIGTDILVPKMDFVRNGIVAFSGQDINMKQLPCRSLFDYTGPAKYYGGTGGTSGSTVIGLENVICGEVSPPTLDNSLSCKKSLSLPNTCPVGYGMDGEGTDDDGYAFDLGDKRQCAKCPIVPTCNGACERCLGTDSDTCENPQRCKDCLSPSGSYRCEVDLTNCDKPGYVETFVRRGGPGAQVSRHCVKTFEEPAYLPWQASTLQKHHHQNGNPFYPHEHDDANGMKWIQNEIYSETRYLICKPGYVPTQEIFDAADVNTLAATLDQYKTTCAGYTCKKCPDGFYEKDQICMKCPNRQIANPAGTGCEYVNVPKGHFFDVTNKAGSDGFPFVSSCDHWLDHPGGSMGAYQDEENQIVCKTVNTTKASLGRHDVMFKGGIVDVWGVKGWRVSQDRTEAVQCEDHQRCNGEEVSGCTSGYIWKEYNENKDIDPCEQCNVDETIKSDHPSRDAYEFCDGTHRFRCAVASYTGATPDTFQTHISPHHQAGDIFVGVRATWNGSRLVLPKSEVRGSLSASFRWKNDFNSNLPRADQYVHNPNFQPRRVTENPAFNQNGQCGPVPNGNYALPDLWQKTDCGAARDLCVDRTFHKIIPYKKDCVDADKYAFTAGIVKEECYDEIFRGSSRTCTDGEKIGGCNREPCQEEGATNCWCADEPDFCTMGCVNDLCQEICGDRVCEEYELCYGEFNQFVSFARCAIECQPPISNYCVVRDGENTKYCRHYNVNWNSTLMKGLDPVPTSECFDEVPNIPETQCEDEFATSCFCGREYFDPPHTHESGNYACVNQVIEPVCSVLQDDDTCIYNTSSSGECICGNEKIDLWNGETCYSTIKGSSKRCGLNANTRPLCENVLGREIPCIAGDYNIVDNENCYNGKLNTVYNTISVTSYKCTVDGEAVDVRGCLDSKGSNHNPYATIPWTCNYK